MATFVPEYVTCVSAYVLLICLAKKLMFILSVDQIKNVFVDVFVDGFQWIYRKGVQSPSCEKTWVQSLSWEDYIYFFLFIFFIQIIIKIETSGFRYWNGNKI